MRLLCAAQLNPCPMQPMVPLKVTGWFADLAKPNPPPPPRQPGKERFKVSHVSDIIHIDPRTFPRLLSRRLRWCRRDRIFTLCGVNGSQYACCCEMHPTPLLPTRSFLHHLAGLTIGDMMSRIPITNVKVKVLALTQSGDGGR
ncbi:hypothetical protein HD554DRAFT_1173758 [Boletus coccyginus]|nr:hypothetical protein HD554DRAFT_1173758 [Boletus coccyginus]